MTDRAPRTRGCIAPAAAWWSRLAGHAIIARLAAAARRRPCRRGGVNKGRGMAAPGKALASARSWAISSSALLRLLLLLFFCSGISGLVYQVLWLRVLSLTFGVTVFAVSTVLASFMAGLAVGSFGAGKLADRLRNPLAAYGIAETLIGLTALVTPELILGLQGVYHALYE